jgi:membrane protein DedA with SNARE-associated domain
MVIMTHAAAADGVGRGSRYRDVMDEQPGNGGAAGAGAVPTTGTAETPDTAGPGQPQRKWDNPQTPWAGRARRIDILCWGAIVLSGVYYYALLPFRASLVGTHPLLGTLLNGSTEDIIAAAAFARVDHGSLVIVLLAAIPGLMKFDLIYWWAGRLWGEGVIMMLSGKRNRGAKYMARVDRWGRKFTWPAVLVSEFLPIPTAIIYVIAGWAGMRWYTFLILDAISSLAWAGVLAGLGYELGHHAVVIAQAISHYGLWVTIGLVVLIVFFQFRSQHRMMRAAAGARTTAQAATPRADGGGDTAGT